MEELLEERLLNEANFRGKCLGAVWDLIRKLKNYLTSKISIVALKSGLTIFELFVDVEVPF